jgi:hypothetical protein
MTSRKAQGAEMPAPGQGRPLGGQLDTLAVLFDFQPSFDAAVERTTAPDSHTRGALHELVCITATRLHIERVVLRPLLVGHPDAAEYHQHSKGEHHRIEVLLALIDRRGASDPDLPSMFQELQDAVHSNLRRQRAAAARVHAELDERQAHTLRRELQTAVDTAMTRPHPHLPRRGPFAGLTTAFFARMDRVRNHAPAR